MSTTRLVHWAVFAALLLPGLSITARAGTIKIGGAQPGTPVTLTFTPGFPSGGGTLQQIGTTADKNGNFSVTIGTLAEEKAYKGKIAVTKTPAGTNVPQTTNLNLNPSGTTLGSLEPFTFPGFTANASLVADIDLDAFLSAGTQFTLGQILTVINGSIIQTPAILFTQGGTPFSGIATVSSFDEVADVPEPSSLALLATGIFASLGAALRSKNIRTARK